MKSSRQASDVGTHVAILALGAVVPGLDANKKFRTCTKPSQAILP